MDEEKMKSGVCARSVPAVSSVKIIRILRFIDIILLKNFTSKHTPVTFDHLITFRLNVPAFIARRIAFNRERSFSRFIIRLAITATVISVGAMIMTLAFTNGFQYAISQKVFNLWGNIHVQRISPNQTLLSEEWPIERNDTVLRMLRDNGEIRTIQAFATKLAVLRSAEGIESVLVKGVE